MSVTGFNRKRRELAKEAEEKALAESLKKKKSTPKPKVEPAELGEDNG